MRTNYIITINMVVECRLNRWVWFYLVPEYLQVVPPSTRPATLRDYFVSLCAIGGSASFAVMCLGCMRGMNEINVFS